MKPAEVYLKYCPILDLYKIGVSFSSKKRNPGLQTGNPYEIITKFIFQSKYPYKVETSLHREFNSYKTDVNDVKLKGEWFKLDNAQVNNFLIRCKTIESNIQMLVDSDNYFILK